MENEAQTIGGRIKKARDEAGISQSDLAKILGFESATAISLIESDERKITAENLGKVAAALHRDVRYFLGDEEIKAVDVAVALRADKDLSSPDKAAILHFIEMAKKKKHDS